MHASPLPPLRAGILIGGASRRMGTPKQLLALRGRPFASRIADAVSPLVESVALLGSGEVPAELSMLERIHDAPGVEGPMSGIIAALQAAPECAWLVVACDMPLLTIDALRWLIAQRATGRLAVIPEIESGRAEPLAAIYEPAALPSILDSARRGEFSLQPFARSPHALVRVPAAHQPAWRNINTPKDLPPQQTM